MTAFNTAAGLLPPALCGELLILRQSVKANAEEIRLRAGQAVSILINGRETEIAKGYRLSSSDLEAVLERATEASVYSSEDELRRGFISVSGGIRLGVCGTAVTHCGSVCGMRDISSLSVRIPHEVRDCGSEAFGRIMCSGLKSTLILSSPGGGKTTCIREYIRRFSGMGYRVSVADERFELAGVYDGEAQFDIGEHTDIISGAPKGEAAMMLIRAMNPQILAMDEVSSEADIEAVTEASGCGIRLLATAHADSVEALYRRPIYRRLLELGEFSYAVIIDGIGSERSYCVKELA